MLLEECKHRVSTFSVVFSRVLAIIRLLMSQTMRKMHKNAPFPPTKIKKILGRGRLPDSTPRGLRPLDLLPHFAERGHAYG